MGPLSVLVLAMVALACGACAELRTVDPSVQIWLARYGETFTPKDVPADVLSPDDVLSAVRNDNPDAAWARTIPNRPMYGLVSCRSEPCGGGSGLLEGGVDERAIWVIAFPATPRYAAIWVLVDAHSGAVLVEGP